jgi:hypothetical protein
MGLPAGVRETTARERYAVASRASSRNADRTYMDMIRTSDDRKVIAAG